MSIPVFFFFCYICGTLGALGFWLIGLALVTVSILTKSALPWMALTGAVFGVLYVIAGAIRANDYEAQR